METKVLSNELIKSVLTEGVVFRGYVSSMEDATQTGFYILNEGAISSMNIPFQKIGLLFVLRRTASEFLQCFFGTSVVCLYLRTCRNNVWNSWYQVSLTATS